MKRTRLVTMPIETRVLHAEFVAAVRAAWDDRSRRCPEFAGTIYWNTEDGRHHYAVKSEHSRLKRLASTLGYNGPLFATEGEK